MKGWTGIGGLLGLVLAASAAHAQHLDVKVSTSGGPVAGSRIELDVYGDLTWYLAQAGGLPQHYLYGYDIFPSDFSDRKGGPYLTDNPGFQSFRSQFAGGEAIGFTASGRLEHLVPGGTRWEAAPGGGGVRLYGAIPDDVVFDYVVNGTREDEYLFYANGTLFGGDGISGPSTAPIGIAKADGSLHYHLNWSLEGTAQAHRGTFLAEMHIVSMATEGGVPKYLSSDPFYVMFRNGVTDAEYAEALRTLIVAPASSDPPRQSAFMRVWAGLQAQGQPSAPAVAAPAGDETMEAMSLSFAQVAPPSPPRLLRLTAPTVPVPEPASGALVAGGLAVLVGVARWRRRAPAVTSRPRFRA